MKRCASVTLLSALIATSGAYSQELEEVVVSARKVEENLQDVPISVTAFDSAQLVERGLDDVFDVAKFTPGFSFEKLNRYGTQGGGSRPVIRGMSQILGEPNASIFVDGLQYNDSILSFPFDIVERVEVIKGPQAALFGRATFAGAINLVTKKGSNEFQNRIFTRVADYSEYEVGFLSRGPIIEDKLFYTANVRWYDFGGMYRNSLDNQRIGDESSVNFDSSLEYRPNDVFNMRFTLGIGRDDDGAAALTLQDRFANNCFLDVARQYFCGEVAETPPSEQNLDLFGGDIGMDKDSTRLALQLEYDLPNFTIVSNTGYFGADQTYGYDVDLTADSTRFGGTFNRIAVSDREELSTEFMLRSNNDSGLRWLAGVYYYRSRRDFREDRLNGSTVDQGEARVDNIALFGSLSYDFTDRLTGGLELRYAEDEIGNFNPAARPDVPLFENTYDSFTPRITLDYQLNDDTMLYGSLARGNKPGFINANPLLPPEFLFADEEEADNIEIGAKNTFADGRIVFNVAAYYIDWTNQQLTGQAFLFDGRPASVVVNAGETTVKGLEMDFTAALSDHWTVGGGLNWTDATFDEFDDAEQAQFTGGDPSVAGNHTPNAPEFQNNLFVRYGFDIGSGWTGFVRGDYAYTSRKFAQIFNEAHTGSQDLLNLRVGFQNGNWDLALFVDNALDDLSPSTVIRFVDFENFLPTGDSQRTSAFVRAFQYPLADRRQWGLTASYSF